MKPVLSIGLIVAAWVCGACVAFGGTDDLHEAVRAQLMVVKASGPPAGSNDRFRMGFIVSEDGLVLTTLSLLDFKDVPTGLITISAAPATTTERPNATVFSNFPAVIYSEDKLHNLLLLQVKGLKHDTHSDIGESAVFNGGGMLLTSGYDHVGQYQTHEGSSPKEAGALWVAKDLDVDDEETGAPVYSSAGRKIVGMALGKTATDGQPPTSGKGYVLPLEYAWPLLLPISVSGDEAKIGEVEKQFLWSLVPAETSDSPIRLRLCYAQFIPTKLKPTSADISVHMAAQNGLNKLDWSDTLKGQKPRQVLPGFGDVSSACDGYFDLTSWGQTAERFKQDYHNVKITASFTVTLSRENEESTLLTKHVQVEE